MYQDVVRPNFHICFHYLFELSIPLLLLFLFFLLTLFPKGILILDNLLYPSGNLFSLSPSASIVQTFQPHSPSKLVQPQIFTHVYTFIPMTSVFLHLVCLQLLEKLPYNGYFSSLFCVGLENMPRKIADIPLISPMLNDKARSAQLGPHSLQLFKN